MTDPDILARLRNGEKVGGLTGELFELAADEIERLRSLLRELWDAARDAGPGSNQREDAVWRRVVEEIKASSPE